MSMSAYLSNKTKFPRSRPTHWTPLLDCRYAVWMGCPSPPPSGAMVAHPMADHYVRFAACKQQASIEEAGRRLRGAFTQYLPDP